MFPLHERYAAKVEGAPTDALREIINDLWAVCRTRQRDLDVAEAVAEAAVPDEDAPGWIIESGYAQSSVASILYAVPLGAPMTLRRRSLSLDKSTWSPITLRN